jgi:site-specific recombinase XerD
MLINEEDFKSFISIKRGLAEQSVRHCMIRIRVINEWFQNKELTKQNVEKFFFGLKEQGRKNNTLNTYRFVFRHLVDYCKDRNLPSDFFDGFKSYKKTKSNIIIYTLEEIEKIIVTELRYGKFRGRDCQFLDFIYRTLTMFLAYTGCRFAEAANLKIKNLDISAGKATFLQTKNNENRDVYFIDPLKSRLEKLIEGKSQEDHVFTNSLGKRVHEQDFSSDLKRRAKEAEITKRSFPHNFRHSYITHILEAGVQATEVAPLTGHKDIQVIYETYMHLADKTLQRAAMKHPLVRRNVNPQEIIRVVKEAIESFHFETDNRFKFSISETGNSLNLHLEAQQ